MRNVELIVRVEHCARDLRVIGHLRPRHVADDLHLDVLVAIAIELLADALHHIRAVHLRHVPHVVLRGDLVRQDRPGAAGVHVAAPDPVHVERDAVAPHLEHRERIVGNEARHAEILGSDFHVDLFGGALELRGLLGRQGLNPFGESLDERRISIVGNEGGQHLDVAPRGAVDRPFVRAMDVGLYRTATPGLAAGRQLDVHAALGSAGNAGASAWRLTAAFADKRVGTLEELGMIHHELAQPDVHPLLVALGDEDQVDRQLARHCLDRHQRIPICELRPFRIRRTAPDQHLLIWRLLDEPAFERRRFPRIRLGDRHGVVLPVDRDRPRRAFVAFGIHDRIAWRAPLGDPDVVDARFLAPELLEEPLHHLGRLGNALTAVRDARLTDPLLQVLDVVVDVLIDVGEDLFEIVVLDLAHVGLNRGVAVRADPELRLGGRGRSVC